MMGKTLGALATATLLATVTLSAQVTKGTLDGVRNFSKVETTIACAGATTPAAVPEIKKLGYKSIVNLRLGSEPGAELEAEAAAAKTANINYFHLPFDGANPDPAVADKFLAVITAPANQPSFVHCASANRASAMWMIKRMLVDGWDEQKASEEAAALGLSNPALKTFALDYVKNHKK
jgi:uncharacterized protein (TIGR01244 family)